MLAADSDEGHLGVGARAEVPTPRCPTSSMGARADLLTLDAPSHPYLAYRRFGRPAVR